MNQELPTRILRAYGVSAPKFLPVQKGYRSQSFAFKLANGKWQNLIIFKREPGALARIKNANYVGDFLASQNFPARQSVDSRIVKLASASGDTYAAIYNYLPGQTVPWEAYTMAHLKTLGLAMAEMHQRLAKLTRGDLSLAADELLTLAIRMDKYFASPGASQALARKLKLAPPKINSENLIKTLAADKNQQPLHLDFVRGNILFASKNEISGILDFEKTAYGAPIIDVARTLAFLLVDCKYKPEAKVRKYFLASGYVKHGGGQVDLATLEPLVDLYLIHDFYKFLRHNPYEFLPKNEHFTRTRDILLARGLIEKC